VRPEVPTQVVGDPVRLKQVLVNLLSNAVKFTDRGEIILRLAFVPVRAMGPEAGAATAARVEFSVRDTGIGISRDALDALFQPFAQGDRSTSRVYGGTGLGLSISRRLCALMGGQLRCASEPGLGATFSFEIPLALPAADRTWSPRWSEQLGGMRVLCVDDSETVLDIVRSLLENAGGSCEVAVCASSAVQRLESAHEVDRPIDAMVVDADMPGQSGLDLVERVRAEPRWAALRIVLVSSFSQRARLKRSPGIAACVAKPLRRTALIEALVAPPPSAAARDAGARRALTAGKARFSRPPRILVADDNVVNQKLVLALLKRIGLGADTVQDGAEALAAVRARPYDLIFMDCHMPGLDGYAATAAIRSEADPTRKQVPIVALTAQALHGDRERCFAAGMNAYLTKPIDPGELESTVYAVLAPLVSSPPEP
jgi:CheY-like chemotaxis protein